MSSLSGNNHGGQQSHGAGGLASQLLGGLTHSSGSGGGQSSSGIGGKLASQLASNLFHSSDKPPPPQNYHGGPSAQSSNSGGLAGSVMGGVAHMFGGKPQSSSVCPIALPPRVAPGRFSFPRSTAMLTASLAELWLLQRGFWRRIQRLCATDKLPNALF